MGDRFSPRPAQEAILAYRGGTMGVSAVPGSGKTWTLSRLAADLIRNGCLEDDQEVLVVTLVNSAVQNFSLRISQFLESFGLVPSLGYRVRTLHGLAHDIVKERPELAGIDNGFQIIDEREATRIREDAVLSWLNKTPNILDGYLISDLPEYRLSALRQKQIPDLLNQIALQFIRTAKNIRLSPSEIENRIPQSTSSYPLVRFGLAVYQEYQRNLAYRGAVDFDDLIIKAYQILTLDQTLLRRLQHHWPYILEDESQDSSLLQQEILSLLADHADAKNWVRVGDPNQAIYESFTTADPQLLNEFMSKADLSHRLPNSGRSTEDIIKLANFLVSWCIKEHPNPNVRDALFPNYIQPTPPDDSQPNPDSRSGQIHLYEKPLDPQEESLLIARSVANWLKVHPDSTAAILAPRNERGKRIASLLRDDFGLEPVELLSSTLSTRKTIGSLVKILSCLINPASPKKLSAAFLVYHREKRSDPDQWEKIGELANLIASLKHPETFLSPNPGSDWLDTLPGLTQSDQNFLIDFKTSMGAWQEAVQLPIDQLILTISSEIFSDASELSLAHKIAAHEKQLSSNHPEWDLPPLLEELRSLARNESRFYAGADGQHFNPDDHKGKVVITTAHKAKGLEWDRVYLISANNYNFPSGADDDSYIPEKWFVRDNLNLPAETLAILKSLSDPQRPLPEEGIASLNAREEYIRERLRLFYVSITRAKKELIITWNTGRNGKLRPSQAFMALSEQVNHTKEL